MSDRDLATLRELTKNLRREPRELGLGCCCGGDVHLSGDFFTCAHCFRLYESVAELVPLRLQPGARVRVRRDPQRDREFTGAAQFERRAVLETHGEVLQYKTGHGLCYLVRLCTGGEVWFDAEELEEECRG